MNKQNPPTQGARGCLLGALIGDAVGARLEFMGRPPTAEEVAEALTMPGGGVFQLAPGQITDDGELTIALAQALAGHSEFPVESVAQSYVRWYQSAPFDVGGTTTMALSGLSHTQAGLAQAVLQQSEACNLDSKANGSLMRQSGLGVWAARVSPVQAMAAARLDAQLTHPNLSCQWAGVSYVLAIRHLMLHPGHRDQAFGAAWEALSAQVDEGASEVLSWLKDAREGQLPACEPMQGFVRIAFTHAFFHLLQGSSYLAGLRSTLAGGGDTDTNACIVGGMLGALHGYSGLPQTMVQTLLDCDCQTGRPRPPWLQASKALELADALGETKTNFAPMKEE